MRIVVVGLDGCLGSGFTGLVDVLTLARRAIANGGAVPFDVVTASVGSQPVRDGLGRILAVDGALEDIPHCHAAVIPGFVPDNENRPPMLLVHGAAADWLRRQHAHGAWACGSCSGVFMLGEAGLLDRRRCTTTWWLHDELKHRYPKANPSFGLAMAEDRRVVTAGGPLSWIDLALHMVRVLCGADAARVAADFAVVDMAPSSQAVYVPAGHLSRANPFLLDAEQIVRRGGPEPVTAQGLARQLGTSARTLHRRLRQAAGESPKRFIVRVRFEMARTALGAGGKPVKQVSIAAGYAHEASFRRAFCRFSGMTPGAYRLWARARGGG